MAKYQIRQPFSIHLEKVETVRQPGGGTIKQRSTQSHFSPNVVELDDADAKAHMHKLEPKDAAARELFDAHYREQADAAKARDRKASGGISLEERVASAVVQALAGAGVIKAQGARA